jgi:3-deoxy-D-manno-octulosonic-acid transferase
MISAFIGKHSEIMNYLIDVAYFFVLLAYSPKILYRILRQDRYKTGWSQRLGKIRRHHPDKPCLWIHAVSVGEVNATRTLVRSLKSQLPGFEIVLTSTTDTGLARAKALYDNDLTVSYFPFDFSPVMNRAFEQIRPDMILLMELEVWPNLVRIARRRQIPVIVVNGRLSDKSFPRYRKIRKLARWMFSRVTLILAQTEEYARRFIDLGCSPQQVRVTGSLKYDTAQTEADSAGVRRLAEQINLSHERLWVAGGTGPDEEQIILDIFKTLKQDPALGDLRLALIPRKPERFGEVAALIEQAGFQFVRFSQLKEQNTAVSGKPPVILGDTMGDLSKFYALASVVFVGRTLTPMGGSDMMEPAALGKCTLFGPHTFNFRQTVQDLLTAGGAIEVKKPQELLQMTRKCLTDPGFASQIADNGRAVIRQNQGATRKTVDAVREIMKIPLEKYS